MHRIVAGVLATLLSLVLFPVSAAAGEAACTPPDPAVPKRQFRAMWIASVVNIDWPSRQGLPVATQQAEYVRWLDEAVRLRMNAVVVQVRPTADAFWPSPYEPWSEWLTGVQGQDPGYDPLAFLVAEAHKRNLEFHAWFNPYRVSVQADPNKLVESHPARVHPDWRVPYGGKLYYNPGIPDVRAFVEDAILDAVRRYDVDAVHFDDYFYPYPVAGQQFDDNAAYETYGGGFPDKASWRRNNIDLLVQELSTRIEAVKPWVKFGISPFAVWRNKATDPSGSDTTAGVQTYDDLAADTRKWVRQQWIDYVVPQVYWNIGFAPADYAKLIPWWSQQVAGTDVQLYIGQATYKVGLSTQSPAWMDPAEMSKHLTYNRDFPAVRGDVYFSAKDVVANRLGHMDLVTAAHYTRPALVPTDDGPAPPRPVVTHAWRRTDGVRVMWVDVHRRGSAYAIYRFDSRPTACDYRDATHLLAVVRGSGHTVQTFDDPTTQPGTDYVYAVTTLDRLHHESAPTASVALKAN